MTCAWCGADDYRRGRCPRCGDPQGQEVTRGTLRPLTIEPVGRAALAAWLKKRIRADIVAALDLARRSGPHPWIDDVEPVRDAIAGALHDAAASAPPRTVAEQLGLTPAPGVAPPQLTSALRAL